MVPGDVGADEDVPPNWWLDGNYDVTAKNPHTLRNRHNSYYLDEAAAASSTFAPDGPSR
jgi:hypothetical protein